LDETTPVDKQKVGIATQMGVYFDGRPIAPGLFETAIAAGNAGKCAAPDGTKTR
jgi:hypothetical protein